MKLVLFSALFLFVAPQTITVSPEAASYVAPVLNAYATVAAHEDSKSDVALERQLAKVLGIRTPATDEALAVLLGFYVGEASGEDISCELVARGKAVLPLLRRYEAASSVVVPGANTSGARRTGTEYSIVERRINSEERCVRER